MEHKIRLLGIEQNPRWWSFEPRKAIYIFFWVLLSLSNKKRKITWLSVHFMHGFDVEIKFKSLYNSLLIYRVSPLFYHYISIRCYLKKVQD